MTNETIDAADVKALESDRDTHLAEVIRLRQQNAELLDLLRDALDDPDSEMLGDEWNARAMRAAGQS